MENEKKMNTEKEKVGRRPARAEDFELLRQIHHKAYHDVVLRQFGEWNEESQDKYFSSDLQGGGQEVILCNGEPCGYFFMQETDKAIELHELVLLPEFQGQGIGSQLLKEVIDKAKAMNIPAHLGVLKENRAANLYRRLGFIQTGETETHFLMEFKP